MQMVKTIFTQRGKEEMLKVHGGWQLTRLVYHRGAESSFYSSLFASTTREESAAMSSSSSGSSIPLSITRAPFYKFVIQRHNAQTNETKSKHIILSHGLLGALSKAGDTFMETALPALEGQDEAPPLEKRMRQASSGHALGFRSTGGDLMSTSNGNDNDEQRKGQERQRQRGARPHGA